MSNNNLIKLVVNKYDPVGLLKMGAPENEYEEEAKAIGDILDQKLDLSDFQTEVKKIFVKYFGDDDPFANLDKMSEEIYNKSYLAVSSA